MGQGREALGRQDRLKSRNELGAWPDYNGAVQGPDRDDEHRLWESTREAFPLAHREPCVPIVLAHDTSTGSRATSDAVNAIRRSRWYPLTPTRWSVRGRRKVRAASVVAAPDSIVTL